MNCAFEAVLAAAPAERALKDAFEQAVTTENYEDLVTKGLQTQVITAEQAQQIRDAQKLSRVVIEVDEFPRDQAEPDHWRQRLEVVRLRNVS